MQSILWNIILEDIHYERLGVAEIRRRRVTKLE